MGCQQGGQQVTLIPDDKAIKQPSIVDEMARAIGQDMFDQDLGGDDEEVTYYLPRMARAAVAVVARRLREALDPELWPDTRVALAEKLLAELEGE
jgi:hypothetical protein